MERILAIEDSRVAQAQLQDILGGRYDFVIEEDGPSGVAAALANPPDLILLDINLPGLNGYEICRLLKPDKRTADVPILFLTSLDTGREKVQGFESGADDYIVKPFYPGELLARINLHLASRREKQMAVELERMKLLREMAVTISHELNNPMTTVFGLLHLAVGELGDGSESVRKHLKEAKQELEKIRGILAKLSSASRAVRTGYVLGEEMIDVQQL